MAVQTRNQYAWRTLAAICNDRIEAVLKWFVGRLLILLISGINPNPGPRRPRHPPPPPSSTTIYEVTAVNGNSDSIMNCKLKTKKNVGRKGQSAFLVACTRLHNPLCRSVRPSVGWSVRGLVTLGFSWRLQAVWGLLLLPNRLVG